MSSIAATSAGRALASAQPYPWPFHGSFDAGRSALVACLDVRWRVGGPASNDSDARLLELAGALRGHGGLVVVITSTPPQARSALARAATPPRPVDWLEADIELAAGATDAFYASALEDILRWRGCSDLLIAGWGLEGPVHSTLRAANDRGFECLLVPDASTPLQPELAFAACEMVRFSGGIFGAFADTASVIYFLADAPTTRS